MFTIAELLEATGGKLLEGKNGLTVKGVSIDSRLIRPGYAFIAIKGENFDGHDFIPAAEARGAACIIQQSKNKEQHIKIPRIGVEDTTAALGDIAGYVRRKFNIPVIAVTGSNGKTTAKDMIAAVLAKKFKVLKNIGTKNNHIGLPVTVLELDASYDFAVLEIGTNHFGEVSYLGNIACPNIGIITNVGSSHLEYLGSPQGVLKEKISLMKCLNSPKIAILNADDNLLKPKISGKTGARNIFSFGIKHKADFMASQIKATQCGIEFLVNRKHRFTLKTLGRCNIYNALAAIVVARLMGMEYNVIAKALRDFTFPQSRLNLIEVNRIRFIDDTYNSNPLSLKEALDALAGFKARGRKIFVMGDMLELGRHTGLSHCQAGKYAAKICDAFIGVGKSSLLAAKSAKKEGLAREKVFHCGTACQARQVLFDKVLPTPDDIILVKGSRGMKMEEVLI